TRSSSTGAGIRSSPAACHRSASRGSRRPTGRCDSWAPTGGAAVHRPHRARWRWTSRPLARTGTAWATGSTCCRRHHESASGSWASSRSATAARWAGFPEADLDYRAYATAADGVGRNAARRAAAAEIGSDFPNVKVLTREQYRDDQEQAIDQFLAVTVALLLLSEIIA